MPWRTSLREKLMTDEKPRVFVARRLPQEILGRLNTHVDLDLWDSDLPPDVESLPFQ